MTLAGAIESKGHQALGEDAGEATGSGKTGMPVTDDLAALLEKGEVVIDFSVPEATLSHLRAVVQHRRAMVIGTTGFSSDELQRVEIVGAAGTLCLLTQHERRSQSSLQGHWGNGQNGWEMITTLRSLRRTIGPKGAPSGTALKIAEVLARAVNQTSIRWASMSRKGLVGERKKQEIGIQTIRAGDIVGDHTVLFGGMGERIEITHRASSRDTFARGALRAARWVVKQPPGLYDMMDVLNLK